MQTSELLNGGLFVARFHTTLSGEALLTLVYHRALDEAWRAEAWRAEDVAEAGKRFVMVEAQPCFV